MKSELRRIATGAMAIVCAAVVLYFLGIHDDGAPRGDGGLLTPSHGTSDSETPSQQVTPNVADTPLELKGDGLRIKELSDFCLLGTRHSAERFALHLEFSEEDADASRQLIELFDEQVTGLFSSQKPNPKKGFMSTVNGVTFVIQRPSPDIVSHVVLSFESIGGEDRQAILPISRKLGLSLNRIALEHLLKEAGFASYEEFKDRQRGNSEDDMVRPVDASIVR